ncbi:MAG: hypothetical protein GX878_06030 [Firmicutes bacterium]|nr:hypothetical protein [Bacillota bacterium]
MEITIAEGKGNKNLPEGLFSCHWYNIFVKCMFYAGKAALPGVRRIKLGFELQTGSPEEC